MIDSFIKENTLHNIEKGKYFSRYSRKGTIIFKDDNNKEVCKVIGCFNEAKIRGYCSKHSSQYQRDKNILTRTKYDNNQIIIYDNYAEIVLYNKFNKEKCRALIDLDDVEKCEKHKWSCDNNGYVSSSELGIRLHRYVTNAKENEIIDHKNRNKLDYRKENLRRTNYHGNAQNISLQKNNKSGITGVYYGKQINKWIANITVDKKVKYLGSYDDINDAIKARVEAEIKYYGEYSTQSHLIEK